MVTNSYREEGSKLTSVTVTKAWKDDNDRDKLRPASVTVRLLANDLETDKECTLSADNKWSHTFENLPTLDEEGETIEYGVEEDDVESYDSEVTGSAVSGFTITNTHEAELMDIAGHKVWEDDDDLEGKRPEAIRVRLLANNVEVDSTTVTAADDWNFTFTDKPVWESGTEISYSVAEDPVGDYTYVVDGSVDEGFTVTNTHNPGKRTIGVSVVWDDFDNWDEIRPGEVTLYLYDDVDDDDETLEVDAMGTESLRAAADADGEDAD